MPYIKNHEHRRELSKIVRIYNWLFSKKGYLNYFLFRLAKDTCRDYKSFRNFLGELEAAKLEIYRKQIASYEDEKIKENGDIE